MSPSSRPRIGNALPAGLLGMLALVAAIEATIDRHDLDFTRPEHSDWHRSGRVARHKVADCRILGYGDSLMKLGLAPRLLEARLGRRAYNLAVSGGQAPSSFVLLRRSLEAGARPDAILVDFMPPLLSLDLACNARRWPELLSLAEIWELARTAGSAGLFAEVALGRLLPSVKDRPEIRACIAGALRGETASMRATTPILWRNWAVNRGAQIMPRSPYRARPDEVELWYRVNFPRPWACHPIHAAYVRRFLRLAAAHRIPVFWVLPPMYPESFEMCVRDGQAARMDGFLRALQDRYPNLTVLDARRSGYPAACFVDTVHLDRVGAATLSTDIADVLARRGTSSRPAGRWIDLPAFREVPGAATLEDWSQSGFVLATDRSRLR